MAGGWSIKQFREQKESKIESDFKSGSLEERKYEKS
jgi:hypothetical protein